MTSGTLTFAPGETVKTVRVQLVDDTVAEGTEVFTMNLSHPQRQRDDRARHRHRHDHRQ